MNKLSYSLLLPVIVLLIPIILPLKSRDRERDHELIFKFSGIRSIPKIIKVTLPLR